MVAERNKAILGKIRLKFGSSEGMPSLEFQPGAVTVLVGPNNSGKSMLLREVEAFAERGSQSERRILGGFEPQLPDPQDARRQLLSRQYMGEDPYFFHGLVPQGYVRVYKMDFVYDQRRSTKGYIGKQIDLEDTVRALTAAKENPALLESDAHAYASIFHSFVSLFTLRLDGSTRLALTEPRPGGNVLEQPRNHLWALAKDEEARSRLRAITSDAFDRYFVIDPTGMQEFRVKMSEIAPPPGVELHLGPESREFFEQATDIADLSDGVKAFTGLTAAALSSDFRVMLIDEPEAFLHPVLAKKLGRRLTQIASDREGNVLAATHSPDFLIGCVEAGAANVVRLTYKREIPSARLLPADALREMMRDPLLSSAGVLSALFHEGAVVCEGDSDRAFYQEINRRLLAAKVGGADNSVFLNAQGKEVIHRIVQPLRGMGIPAAAIVDVDILKKKHDFTELLKVAGVPEDLRYSWGEQRGRTDSKLRSKDANYKIKGGIALLETRDKEAADNLLSNLAEYGVFVVPKGELESWLEEWIKMLNANPAKYHWVPKVFELMGADPSAPEYLGPQEGDVWDFIRRVGEWIGDPRRKGMPE